LQQWLAANAVRRAAKPGPAAKTCRSDRPCDGG
jgi:hypothetical protein